MNTLTSSFPTQLLLVTQYYFTIWFKNAHGRTPHPIATSANSMIEASWELCPVSQCWIPPISEWFLPADPSLLLLSLGWQHSSPSWSPTVRGHVTVLLFTYGSVHLICAVAPGYSLPYSLSSTILPVSHAVILTGSPQNLALNSAVPLWSPPLNHGT